MAQCITEQFGSSTCPQLRLTVTQSSQTETTAILSWVLDYVAHGYAVSSSNSRAYSAVVNGATVASGNFAFGGVSSTTRIANGTVTINKTTSAQTISFSCSMAFNLTWSGVYGGTKSSSESISVGAKTSYKVTYNANGGSGAPGSQTKWHGTNIKLSSVNPSRTGYSFKGWSTSSNGSVQYASGATYSSNSSVVLYAVWQANTYTVSYNANGGTGAPDSQTKTYGITLTLSSTVPTKTNYNFKGWGVSETSITADYTPGSNYTANAAIILYAIWELAYTAPRITNVSIERCDSNGTLNEAGTCALVTFDWVTDKAISSITIENKRIIATTWTTYTVSVSGTNGTVNEVVGSSDLSVDYIYDIRITVTDSVGSSIYTSKLYSMEFVMDFLNGGKGIAFGKAAEKENTVEVSPNWLLDANSIKTNDLLLGNYYIGAVPPTNQLVNTDWRVAQRTGESSYTYSGTNARYTFDRWWLNSVQKIEIEPNTSPAASINALKMTIGGSTWNVLSQPFEDFATEWLGRTVTISVWMKADKNSKFRISVGNSITTIDLTTEWKLYTTTVIVTNNTNNYCNGFYVSAASNSTTDSYRPNYVWMTAPQVVYGAHAGEYYPSNKAVELEQCRRFYYKDRFYRSAERGITTGASTGQCRIGYPESLREKPSKIEFSYIAIFGSTTSGVSIGWDSIKSKTITLNTYYATVDVTVNGTPSWSSANNTNATFVCRGTYDAEIYYQ